MDILHLLGGADASAILAFDAAVALCALGIAAIAVAAEWLLARGGRRR